MSGGYFGGILGGAGGGTNPVVPTLSLQVAFGNGPFDPSPTWTEIRADLASFTTQIGKQHQLDRVNPSTLMAMLDNRAGTYSPWSTLSPYAGQLTPGTPVRVVATWASVSYPRYYGFVDAWTPRPVDALNQDVELKASDVLKQLNQKYLINATLWPNEVLGTSPTAFYRFDEPSGGVMQDASGNANPGRYYGTIGYSQPGAVLYDPDAAITIANSAGYGTAVIPGSGGAGAFSFSIWFKTTATNQQVLTWAANTGVPPTVVSLIVTSGGNLALGDGQLDPPPWSTFSPSIGIESGTGVTDGNWHHAVVTMGAPSGGNSLWTLYLDGVSLGTWTGESWGATLNLPLYIAGIFGKSGHPEGGTFNGSLDELSVHSSALSSSDVAALYAVGSYFQNVEYTGQRIAKALIVAGYGSFPQNLATGTVLCAAETSPMTQSLAGDYCLMANDTENGLFWQDVSGVIQFKDRHYPQINPMTTTSQATIGDNASATYHYEVTGLAIPQDDLDLWPDVKTQRNGGVIQEVLNTAAAAAYGERTLQRSSLLMHSDVDALYLAQWLNYLYSSPLPRVNAVTLSSTTNAGVNLPQMLGRSLWDSVTMQRQAAGESPLDQVCVIESMGDAFDATEPSYKTTWALSPFEVSDKAKAVLIWGTGLWDTNVWGG